MGVHRIRLNDPRARQRCGFVSNYFNNLFNITNIAFFQILEFSYRVCRWQHACKNKLDLSIRFDRTPTCEVVADRQSHTSGDRDNTAHRAGTNSAPINARRRIGGHLPVGTHLPADVRVCFGDEVADLARLNAVRVGRVDPQLGPAVRQTTVDRQQHDSELHVAHPARHAHATSGIIP